MMSLLALRVVLLTNVSEKQHLVLMIYNGKVVYSFFFIYSSSINKFRRQGYPKFLLLRLGYYISLTPKLVNTDGLTHYFSCHERQGRELIRVKDR